MSLNKSNGLQLHQGEITIQHESNVEIKFSHVKYSSEHMKGSKCGHLYLTNFRLVFVNDKKNDMMHTFSMPFKLIKDFDIKQPVFGANFLEGKISAEETGGWQGSAKIEITFKSGGAVEFGQKLIEMAKNPRMMYIASPQPPIIITPVPPVAQGYAVAGSSNAYCFPAQPTPYPAQYQPYPPPPQPYQSYPQVAPPMYPQQPQNPAYPSPADMKAQEAQASATGHNLPPAYDAAMQTPPPYSEHNGKI